MAIFQDFAHLLADGAGGADDCDVVLFFLHEYLYPFAAAILSRYQPAHLLAAEQLATGLLNIRGAVAFVRDIFDRLFDPVRRRALVKRMAQHHRDAQDRRQRISFVLAHDIGRAAVHRLVHADLAAKTCRRQHADGAGEHRRLVAQNIAEHVGRDDDIELLRIANQLHGAVVDQDVLQLDAGVASLFCESA